MSGAVVEAVSPVVRRVRAYLAPVARSTETATLFDPAHMGAFNLDAPPAPWVDLGWVHHFKRASGTKIEPVRSGSPAVTRMQVRTDIEASVSMEFAGWGKLQLAITAGAQQMNLLRAVTGSAAATGGMKVSGVVGFCDREGSSFFQEWSGLFVLEGQQGERVLLYYPRLQAATGAAEIATSEAGLETVRLAGMFRALPVKDVVDGEQVVCFRSYLPA